MALIKNLWVYSGNIAEEAVQGGKTTVSGTWLVMSVFFEVIEKGDDLLHSY